MSESTERQARRRKFWEQKLRQKKGPQSVHKGVGEDEVKGKGKKIGGNGSLRKNRKVKDGGKVKSVWKRVGRGSMKREHAVKERKAIGGSISSVSSRGFKSCQTLEGQTSSSAFTKSARASLPEGSEAKNQSSSDSESEPEHCASDNDETGEGGKAVADTTAVQSVKKKWRKKRRYILFVGNLPKASSKDEIIAHFEKKGIHIQEFRLLTHKDTGRSKGCGFMELGCDRELQNALKFHRTTMEKRHLNIEVTCGGGGNTQHRKAKIEEKNKTLRLKKSMAHPIKHH